MITKEQIENNEVFTIVNKATDYHYDTNDQRFYASNWDKTYDSKDYLERLINNNSKKFEGCTIEKFIN